MKYEEYEMPEDYKRNLTKFTEMLKERENFAKNISFLPPDKRRRVAPEIRDFDKSLEELEQHLAKQYADYQARERNLDEKAEALWEKMEQIFIVAKHRFEPKDFEEYEKKTTEKMDAPTKAEFYERIAIRESYDLHNILAALRPRDGSRYKPPMKSPFLQNKEAMYEIQLLVFEMPEDFKEMNKLFEEGLTQRKAAANRIKYANPRRQPYMKANLAKLDQQIEVAKIKLMDFLEICLNEDGRVERENIDSKKLDEAFKKAGIASERMLILYKHSRPELVEGFMEIQLSVYDTPEEIAAFHERIAKREAEELNEILRSVGLK